MSSFLRTALARRTPVFRASIATPTRSFHISRTLAAGKESALNVEGRAEEVESAKQDQFHKAKTGTNEHKDELASDSESALRADKGQTKDSQKDIADLQKATAKKAEAEQK